MTLKLTEAILLADSYAVEAKAGRHNGWENHQKSIR